MSSKRFVYAFFTSFLYKQNIDCAIHLLSTAQAYLHLDVYVNVIMKNR